MMVSGLPYDATEEDVRSYLTEQCGETKRISVLPGDNGKIKGNYISLFSFSTLITGIAFVDFETVEQLTTAIDKSLSMAGRNLRTKVAEKKSRQPRDDRGGGGGGFGNSGGGFGNDGGGSGGQKRKVINSN